MGNTTAASIWEEAPTSVHEGMTWLARGLEDGEVEGRTFGPQPERYWRMVIFFQHPEMSKDARAQYTSGFWQGVMVGVQQYVSASNDDVPETVRELS